MPTNTCCKRMFAFSAVPITLLLMTADGLTQAQDVASALKRASPLQEFAGGARLAVRQESCRLSYAGTPPANADTSLTGCDPVAKAGRDATARQGADHRSAQATGLTPASSAFKAQWSGDATWFQARQASTPVFGYPTPTPVPLPFRWRQGPGPKQTIVSDTWLGGTGNWSNAAKWSNGVPNNMPAPGSSYNVFIDKGNPAASTVQLDMSPTINNLTIDSDDSLTVLDGFSLIVAGTTINNSNPAGGLDLDASESFAQLIVAGSNATLTGGGTFLMSNNPHNNIYGLAPANVLTNQETIQGAGDIGNGSMAFKNTGTVIADQSSGLSIKTSNGFVNSGTVEATSGATLTVMIDSIGTTNSGTMQAAAGGTLVLTGGAFNNGGGTIRALNSSGPLPPSTVMLENAVAITGGTLTTTGNGAVVVPSGQSATLTGLTIAGNYAVENGGSTTLNGTINLTGNLALNSAINFTSLVIGSSKVTLAGTGTLTMSNFPTSNVVYGSAAANVLNNQATIQGSGTIGYDPFTGINQLALVNSGTINGNQFDLLIETSNGFANSGMVEATNGGALTVANDALGTTNKGTMQATIGGTLFLSGNSVNNTSGTIRATEASTVILQDGVTITGGTLTTTGNGNIVARGPESATLSGLTMSGNYVVSDGASTTLAGAINFKGNVSLNSTGDTTQLVIGSSKVTLAGGGTVTLSASSLNYIQGSAATNVLASQVTIQGSGDIGNDSLGLSNSATINANQPIGLTINTSSGFANSGTVEATNGAQLTVVNDALGTTNSGTMQATTGGTLVLAGNSINNTGGTIQALNSAMPSTVILGNAVAITGGKLTTTGNGTIVVSSGQSATLNGLTMSGNYSVPDGASTTLNGATINGTISLNGATENTALVIGNSNATIGSTGRLTMSNSGFNLIYGSAPANRLTNQGTIEGSVAIGYDPYLGAMGGDQMALVNSGTINVNFNKSATYIETTNGFTNSGTVETTNVSSLMSVADATGITNSGTMEATATGSILDIFAPKVSNSGTISASNSALIEICGYSGPCGTFPVVVANAGGTISANKSELDIENATINGGKVTLTGPSLLLLDNTTIQGGTVTNSATGAIETFAMGNTLASTVINPAGGLIEVYTGSLTLAPAAGSNLAGTISNGGTLTVSGSSVTLPGSVVNSGTLVIGGSSLTLGPTAVLTNGAYAEIYGSAAANRLVNQGTIAGAGAIGLNPSSQPQMALVNSGTIDANVVTLNTAIVVATSNGFQNSGTVEATDQATLTIMNDTVGTTNTGIMQAATGGTLALVGNRINNAGGIIQALNSAPFSSRVTLQGGVTISGGILTSFGGFGAGGIAVPQNQSATLNGLTMSGVYKIGDGGSTTLEGTIKNTGFFQLESTGTATNLMVSGNVTLNGGGTINLFSPTAIISGATGKDTLINVDNTIEGSGTIGNTMALNNQGTIEANQSATTLNLQVSNASTNSGILEATSGGTLVLNGGTWANAGTLEATGNGSTAVLSGVNFANTKGTILAGTGSVVQLENGAQVVGGTLTSIGTGFIGSLGGGAKLQSVTNAGTYVTTDGSSTTLAGTITNNGSMQLNSTGSPTQLLISGNVTLTGSGALTLSNNANNVIAGASAGNEVLTNTSTIQGAGNIGNSFMGLMNKGTIAANQGTELFINPSSAGFQNQGDVAVSAGSTLDITGPAGSFLNFSANTGTLTGGTYSVSGTLQFGNANIVTSSASITLNGTSWQIIDQSSHNALANFATNAGGGTFSLAGGANFTTPGNFTNSGTLNVGSGSAFIVSGNLTNFSGTTLSGGTYNVSGTLEFNGANIITDAAKITLTSPSSQILNQSSANALANLSTVATGGSFTLSGGRNFTLSANFTNKGLVAAENGSNFIGLASFTNSGTLDLGAGSSLTMGGNNNFIQSSSTAVLDIGITGTATGADVGLIDVTDSASLAGKLEISLTDGSLLTVGESFQIVTGQSVSCSSWAGLEFPIDSSEHFLTKCNSNNIALAVESGPDTSISRGFATPQPDSVATPEPRSLFLLGTVLLGLAWLWRRKSKPRG